ncbi:MAG: hypothetical protein OHK0038_13540 [Flammeovirgaceae bacterium]
MKKIVIFLLLFFTLSISYAQTHFVLHVKGNILRKDTKQALKIGEQISEDTQLIFNTPNALAVVMSKEKGRMVLDGRQSKKEANGEFVALMKDALLPMKTNMMMSTRGSVDEEIVNFKDYFGENDFAIIGEKLKLKINKDKYPLTDQQVIVVKYTYEGKNINKQILSEENWITLEKNAIFDNGVDVEKVEKVDLYYYNKTSKDFSKLVTFHPIFVEEDELKAEVSTLVKFLHEAEMPSAKIRSEVTSFVRDLYGKIDELQLKQWLEDKQLIH